MIVMAGHHAIAENFAASPSGYFISIVLVVVIPSFGYAFKKLIDRLTAQDTSMRKMQEAQAAAMTAQVQAMATVQGEQARQSEALSMILAALYPPGHDPLATTLALVKQQLQAHIDSGDMERRHLSEQISDLRQTQLDRPKAEPRS